MHDRLFAVRQKFSDWGIDTLVLSSLPNYRWLSGFTGSACTLVITQHRAFLGTDFRYWEQARQQAPAFELVKMGRGSEFAKLSDMLAEAGAKTVGFEGSQVAVSTYGEWRKQTQEMELSFKALVMTLEPLRDVKSEAEVDILRRAAAITDSAMGQVNRLAKPGMTEKQLAWELEKIMRDEGADGIAFDIIVASGPNAALAHHHPGERPLQEGDSIVIDMGALLNGYHADMTRSFYLGNEPDDKFWQVYHLVQLAQENALDNMRAGMSGAEIDALARDVIEDAGQGENFGHSLGHGVGLEIHEGPRLSALNLDPIPVGSVVTVEPGVYLPEWGGVRIEDLVLVTQGGVEFLSRCPKEPVIPVG